MKGCLLNIFCKCDPIETYTSIRKIKDSTQHLFDKIKQLEVHLSETRELINELKSKKEKEIEVEVLPKAKK